MSLRFHWMLPLAGEMAMKTPEAVARYRVDQTSDGSPVAQPDLDGWVAFARAAEKATIESVLISFEPSRARPSAGCLRPGPGDEAAQAHHRPPRRIDRAGPLRAADEHPVGSRRGARRAQHGGRQLEARVLRLRRFRGA